MKSRLLVSIVAGALVLLSLGAFAQTQQQDHQEHHPGDTPAQVQPQQPVPPAVIPPANIPAPPAAGTGGRNQMPMGQMMQMIPEQCRSMMQGMPHNCMQMMHQMMEGRMGGAPAMPSQPSSQSPATKAYMEAVEKMRVPMMEGIQGSDEDVAFVRGMIAHHQGAIDLAQVVLQYGSDTQAKKWAGDVLRERQREIVEMQDWLKKRAR